MARTITGVLLDAYEKRVDRAEIAADLRAYYAVLDCNCIDIVSRTIGGKRYDIVCDDEGLFKEDCRISAVDSNYEPMLVGSLFVCQHDGEGNEISISEDDIAHVLRYVRTLPTRRYPDGLVVITNVGY